MNVSGLFLEKKGEASWALISIIILLVSLAVLIGVFINLNNSVSAQREACHTSAVLKGTVPDVGGVNVKNAISLNCVTKKVCVSTESKGQCTEQFGEKFETIKVSGTNEEKQKQILQLLAREMADCWNMMGEGKLVVFSREVLGDGSSYSAAASICTRIAFDETILDGEDQVTQVSGLNNYLLTHKVPGKQVSYWDYFRDTLEGDTLAKMTGEKFIQESEKDILDLKVERAIMYTEFKANEIGSIIGGSITGLTYGAIAKGKVFSSLGLKAGLGVVIAGSWIGDKAYLNFLSETDGKESVPGLFMIEYTKEGFDNWVKDNKYFYIGSKV
jgi:hypothetical protein